MPVRVAINGFGRIGRQLARHVFSRHSETLALVAINTLGSAAQSAHLFQYDSISGRNSLPVEADGENALVIAGKRVSYFEQEDPAKLCWGELGIDLVIECTGKHAERGRVHLEAGAARVIVAGSAREADITVCMGVNHEGFDPFRHRIICGGSCTANSLAPLVKILDEALAIEWGMVTFLHSYTKEQSLLDDAHPDLRRRRSATRCIIPTTTSAIEQLGAIFPALCGKIDGLALRVPTPVVHAVDFVAKLQGKEDKVGLLHLLEKAARGSMKNILAVSREPLVSMDLRGSGHSCIVDAEFSGFHGDLLRILAWHDNECAYCARICELAEYVGARTRNSSVHEFPGGDDGGMRQKNIPSRVSVG